MMRMIAILAFAAGFSGLGAPFAGASSTEAIGRHATCASQISRSLESGSYSAVSDSGLTADFPACFFHSARPETRVAILGELQGHRNLMSRVDEEARRRCGSMLARQAELVGQLKMHGRWNDGKWARVSDVEKLDGQNALIFWGAVADELLTGRTNDEIKPGANGCSVAPFALVNLIRLNNVALLESAELTKSVSDGSISSEIANQVYLIILHSDLAREFGIEGLRAMKKWNEVGVIRDDLIAHLERRVGQK